MRVAAVLLALLVSLWTGLALAQEEPSQSAWQALASRAETAIDAERASSAALENLRAEIATYRETFLEDRDQNASRIRTLEAQLEALGAPPENGEEPADLADLRQRLNAQLDVLRVPRIRAEEAYSLANGLIAEIDGIIRKRQTRKLLSRGPSPMTPAYWSEAWGALQRLTEATTAETAAAFQAPSTRVQAYQRLPLILLLTGVGAVLIVMGVRWAEQLGNALRRLGGRGSGAWSFVVSLLRIGLPLAGVLLLTMAIGQTSLLGLRGQMIVAAIPKWAAILIFANWLADRLYNDRDGRRPLIEFTPSRRRKLRVVMLWLALMIVTREAIDLLDRIEKVSEGARAVIGFVPVALTGLLLLRFLQIGRRERAERRAAMAAIPEEEREENTRRAAVQGFLPLIRRLIAVLALVTPILAAVGYVYTAEALIYPLVLTLALVAVVLVLQRFVGDIYAFASRRDGTVSDTLFFVLAGFVLAMLALPVLALIWGARVADMTELWARFLEGFRIGDSTISPVDFLTFVVIFAVGYMITRLLQGTLRTSLLPKTRIDPGGQNAIVSGTGYVGIFLAAIIAISGAGLDLSSVAIVAGALSVGIGFGLQTIVSNFVSGIILLVERPISKGDWIEVGGTHGTVRDISVRSTVIETFDRSDVIVPNSDLISGRVTNYTRGKTVGRVIVPVGVAYGTDTRKVEAILREIAEDHPMVLAKPEPAVLFMGFGADSLDFEIRVILRDVNWSLSVKSELNHAIAKAFTEHGIEIPYAQRDIWLRNPEALRDAARPERMQAEDDAGDAAPPEAETEAETEAESETPGDPSA